MDCTKGFSRALHDRVLILRYYSIQSLTIAGKTAEAKSFALQTRMHVQCVQYFQSQNVEAALKEPNDVADVAVEAGEDSPCSV